MKPTRRFVVIGQRASSTGDFSLADLPSTSGRLDVLLRCLRAALLVSHGLRRESIVYLVLLGGARAPRTIKIDGGAVRFVRPDERSLANLVMKALDRTPAGEGFVEHRAGIAVADTGLDGVLADLGAMTPYVLEEGADDVRGAEIEARDPVFFVGDHIGFDDATRARIAAIGARPIGIGPVSVHADDAITVLVNELDRRDARR